MKNTNLKQPDSSDYLIIQDELIPFLDEMLQELYGNKLEVCLIPYGDGKCYRVAHSQNPVWYQELCSLYPDTRSKGANKKKPRTLIKRQYTIKVLGVMINKKKSRSMYADFLTNIAKDRFKSMPWFKSMQPVFEPWAGQF